MATGDSQLLPQRTKSLPRSPGHRPALRDLGWLRKPRSNTTPGHQLPSVVATQPHSHTLPHPSPSHDASIPRVLAAAGRLAASENARITQTVDLGNVLHTQAVHSRLVHAAGLGHASRHVESIGQKLMAADTHASFDVAGTMLAAPKSAMERPRGQNNNNACVSRSASGKSLERLLQSFPDVAADPQPLRDFVCSLDHAGIRWYGRMFVGSRCLFFTGTGISLSSGSTRRSASTATRRAPDNTWSASANSKSVTSLASVAPPQFSGRGTLPRTAPDAVAAMDNVPAQSSGAKKPWRRTAIRVQLRDITRVNKELTMGFWPNAITVGTTHRQYIFTNFLRRDRAHRCLSDAWQEYRARVAEEALRPASPTPTHRGHQQRRANRISVSGDSVAGEGICDMAGRDCSSAARCESESTVCETPGTSDHAAQVLAPSVVLEAGAETETSAEAETDTDEEEAEADMEAESSLQADAEISTGPGKSPDTYSGTDTSSKASPAALPPSLSLQPLDRKDDPPGVWDKAQHREDPLHAKKRAASTPTLTVCADAVDVGHSQLFILVSVAVFLLFSSIVFP
ncbi:hypothetical protein GGF40_003184 [Coemansia sp. RSA 1286]|nr:hypothetical protein GGF40_003184 [Coemansia sp. RSA 1286]